MTSSCLEILDACLSGDNSKRLPAESQLKTLLHSHPSQTLIEFIQIINSAPRDDLKQLAAVYIRRALKTEHTLQNLPQDFTNQFKTGLLSLLSAESLNLGISKKVCDIVEIVAVYLLPKNEWPELLQFIQKMLSSQNSNQVVAGLYLLGLVSGALDANFVPQILELLVSKIQHSDLNVRVETMRALCRVAPLTEDISAIVPAVPTMFQLFSTNLGDKTCAVLEDLTEIAKFHCELFHQYLEDIHQLISSVVENSNDPDVRGLSLEFLVALTAADPQPIRRSPNFINACIEISMKVMLSLQHDESQWNADEDDFDEQDFDAASSALNRISEAIGANKFVGPCKQRIDKLLSSSEWNFKYTGLTSLLQVMETLKSRRIPCRKIFATVTPFVQDPHPRVRYAAISCIAIMCSDFGSKFVTKNTQAILNSFFSGMQDAQNPRLQSLGTKSLVNFCERSSRKTFLKHLNQIMEALMTLANSSQIEYVQSQICNAVGVVADTAGVKFKLYYETFSCHLLRILQHSTDDFLKLEALSSLSQIGRAVGPDLFKSHAATAMQFSQTLTSPDIDTMQLLESWGRIAETLRNEFQDYLLPVVQSAAKFAGQEIELTNYDSDNEDSTKIVEHDGSVKVLDINKLEEKESGLILLGKLAVSCPGPFSEVLKDAVSNTMPLVSYPYSKHIRCAALESMTGFVQCAIDNMQKYPEESKTFVLQTLETFCNRLSQEREMKVLSLVAYQMFQIISKNKEFSKATLTPQLVPAIVGSLISCVKGMNERINTREAQMNAPMLDEEDKEEFLKDNDNEKTLSQDVTDALKSLLEIYKDDLLSMILIPDFEWMIGSEAHPIQRTTVLQIFCYIFETCPKEKTADLMKQTLMRFIQCMDEEECTVRQAAVYATGLVVEQLTGNFEKELVTQILQKCFGHFDTQLDSNAYDCVLDNDTSVIGKILRFHPKQVPDLGEAYRLWLEKCFPMREDTQESVWCYEYFCELIQKQESNFLGQNMANLPYIVNALIDGYGTNLMSEQSEKFFKTLMIDMQRNNESLYSQTLVKLQEDNQRKILQLIQETRV